MKLEHRDIIERAKLHQCMPSELASELLERDLANLVIDLIPGFKGWSEDTQRHTIERTTLGVKDAVRVAIGIIAANGVDAIPLTVADAKFKPKAITISGVIDAKDPNRHGLIDVAGKLCLLVLAPNDYSEALDSLLPERDQKDLPLHVSNLTGSLFDKRPTGPDEPDGEHPLGTAEELAQRTGGAGDTGADLDKEFGEFTYDDAKQLIVLKSNNKAFKGHWVQSRLAIDSDKTATLLLRLLDDKVLEIETEGESAFDHSFKVIATLADVT